MPTYQYACTACDAQLEVVQKFSDEPLTECTKCGGRLRKIFSAVGIVFKGSGFYRTDNRPTNGSNGAGKKAEATSDGKSGSTASSASSSSSSSGESGGSSGKSAEKVA